MEDEIHAPIECSVEIRRIQEVALNELDCGCAEGRQRPRKVKIEDPDPGAAGREPAGNLPPEEPTAREDQSVAHGPAPLPALPEAPALRSTSSTRSTMRSTVNRAAFARPSCDSVWQSTGSRANSTPAAANAGASPAGNSKPVW